MEAINSFHGKKTMVIIAHRLNTIEKCDMIYKVEGGKITQTTLQEIDFKGRTGDCYVRQAGYCNRIIKGSGTWQSVVLLCYDQMPCNAESL